MPAAARRVRQLRLRADSTQAVRRMLPGLEDALRTASLPDSGGRLLLVRRLALGRIAADAAPASLALALERAVAAARIDCLPAHDPAAASARAVWFRDPLDAHLALALRLLEGPPPREWFWPLAVPAWSPGLERPTALAALAASLAALPEAAAAQPVWLAALLARGHRAALLAALGPALVERLQVAPGMQAAARTTMGRDTLAASVTAVAAASAPDGHSAAARVGPAPMRSFSVPPPMPPRPASLQPERSQPERRRAASVPPVPRTDPPAHEDIAAVPPSVEAMTHGAAAAPQRGDASPATTGLAATSAPAARPGPAPATAAEAVPGMVDRAAADLPFEGLPTAAGGIGFVLPVLARLGYPQWQTAHPALAGTDFAQQVLARLLCRLRIAPDDPAWAIVAARDSGAATIAPLQHCMAPERWSALALRHDRRPLRIAADAPIGADELAALWARAVHRALRRHARIGLADLVCRPALLALTATHLDLRFDLGTVDLRIRRAGLDLDPGWLPWFGRVVGFHYARRP